MRWWEKSIMKEIVWEKREPTLDEGAEGLSERVTSRLKAEEWVVMVQAGRGGHSPGQGSGILEESEARKKELREWEELTGWTTRPTVGSEEKERGMDEAARWAGARIRLGRGNDDILS